MSASLWLVLHSIHGTKPDLAPFVKQWSDDGIRYVVVVGQNAAELASEIEALSAHQADARFPFHVAVCKPGETVDDAVGWAQLLASNPYDYERIVEL